MGRCRQAAHLRRLPAASGRLRRRGARVVWPPDQVPARPKAAQCDPAERVDFDQLERNVRGGRIDAAAVVATSALRVARLSFTAACSRRRRTIAAGSTTLLPNSWTSTCSPRRRFPGSSPPCRSSNRSALAIGTSTAGRASTRRSSRRSRSVRDAWSWWRSPRRPERAGPDRRACPARGPRAVLAAAAGDHIGRGAAREAHGCRR